ncbi:MAG: peptidoglycan DD-metalloendopeptidase family protein [Cellvibrionaceae bacterium]
MPTSKQTLFIPYKHLVLVLTLLFILIAHWFYTPQAASLTQDSTTAIPLNLPLSLTENIDQISTNPKIIAQDAMTKVVEPPEKNEDKVVIRQGDILSLLFDQYNLGQTTLRNILSADESLLALETLRPGQILYFRYKENTQYLKEMELYKHAGHRIIYRRIEDNVFNYETIIQEGEWLNKRIEGKVENTFYLSAQRAGLTETEAGAITRIFQDQLDFSRAIRKGDKFQIVRSVQMIDGQPTGQTRIDSARIQRRAHEHTAFLFDDGRYYDKQGKSLARAFTRTPLAKNYRISSSFNPRRVHPVTGRIAPHNGTDFATPTGTKVLSTGDGVVTRVGSHPFAGHYIDIKHGGQYKTRYLHLHKILVRRGESISRGQAIALSGNSGRSTGPHLHFELHIYGRPVDPMKAKIPITKSIAKKYKHIFAKKVTEQTLLLDTATEIAVRQDN